MSGLAVSQNRSISNIILKGGRDQHANGIFRQAKVIRKKYYKGNVNFQQQIIVAEFTTKYIISLHSKSSS